VRNPAAARKEPIASSLDLTAGLLPLYPESEPKVGGDESVSIFDKRRFCL
jgi:hypothetical protein